MLQRWPKTSDSFIQTKLFYYLQTNPNKLSFPFSGNWQMRFRSCPFDSRSTWYRHRIGSSSEEASSNGWY